jgi:hypothetical protein
MAHNTFSIYCLLYISIPWIFFTADNLQAKGNKGNGGQKPVTPTRPVGFVREAGKNAAAECFKQSLDFYISIMAKRQYETKGTCGGWASSYSSDLKRRMGEWRQIGPDWVCIQSPGTPFVGRIMLQGYLVLGDERYLNAARQVGNLLLAGANEYGGFAYEMWLGPDRPHGVHQGAVNPPDKPRWFTRYGTMDDYVTQDAVEFLYELWLVCREERYYKGYLRGLGFFLKAQKNNGSIPQAYPGRGYSALATFNDGVMLTVFQALVRGYQRTGDRDYFDAAIRIAQWVKNNRIGDSGWSTQTTDDGKPHGARSFEPPSVGVYPTWHAFIILTEAYKWTKDENLLEAMPGAYEWLKKAQLPNGKWARFYYPNTTRPRYRNAKGQDVDDVKKARSGYAWQGDWGKNAIEVYDRFMAEKHKLVTPNVPKNGIKEEPAALILPKYDGGYPATISDIVAAQDSRGTFEHDGDISNTRFASYVAQLIRFLRDDRGDGIQK